MVSLAATMNDNLVSGDQVAQFTENLITRFAELPKTSGSSDFEPYAYHTEFMQKLVNNPTLAKLAQHYRNEKKRLGYVDYSDQVVLAEQAARDIEDVKLREQQKFTQILLDEYQDTSFLQTRLLRTLFLDQSVFAVGDPNQSIYGWRGASASNLTSFGKDFSTNEKFGYFELPTSWRNPKKVLELANFLAEDLALPTSYLAKDPNALNPVKLQPASYAEDGNITAVFSQNMVEEAKTVAAFLAEKVKAKPESTAALLMRKRGQMSLFVTEMQNAGLTVEVVGLGGLLEMPEIVDLVSALRVIHSPDSGTEVIRLLTGARWRIGAKDIQRLHDFARRINKLQKNAEEFASEDALSLVDALDLLREPREANFSKIPEPALSRMIDAAELLAKLRRQTGLPLAQFVRMVEQELWLDIEVVANPRRPHPMAHLNAFANIVAGYAASNHKPYLGAFLTWLEFADEREKFEVPTANPEAGVVQVLTIHAAKGLEWDHVAIANLIQGDFPSTGRETSGWLANAKLPWPLRGDQNALPAFEYSNVDSQKTLKASVETFSTQVKEHLLREELRLMYVAVTRPRANLLLTGSYFKPGNKKARVPSDFLIKAVGRNDLVRVDSADGQLPAQLELTNALLELGTTEQWPLNPLGLRHEIDVRRAAEQTRAAIVDPQRRNKVLDSLLKDLDLLFAEQSERLKKIDQVELPVRVSASKFKDFVADGAAEMKRQLRPMPSQPYAETLAGTLFHTMMEQRFVRKAALGDVDFDLLNVYVPDLAKHREIINSLDANFAKSRWAGLEPKFAEIEIQVAIDDNVFICKLDAVFEVQNDSNFEVEIVDWKTGKPPTDKADLENRSLQLAMYRMAYSRLTGIAPEKISCSLYFVQSNEEVTPNELLLSEAELLAKWKSVSN